MSVIKSNKIKPRFSEQQIKSALDKIYAEGKAKNITIEKNNIAKIETKDSTIEVHYRITTDRNTSR